MSALDTLPIEIIPKWIFPNLSIYDLCSFGHACTVVRKALVEVAKLPYQDRTIDGEVQIINFNGDVALFFRHKIKMRILEDSSLFKRLANAKKQLASHTKYPSPIETYLKLADQASITGLAATVVPFDFFTKKIPGAGPWGLGCILKDAIKIKSLELVQAIFYHPNANQILLAHHDGLFDALFAAVKSEDPKLVKTIAHSPGGAKIPMDGVCGIIQCLYSAIKKAGNAEIVKTLLSLPQCANIPPSARHYSLGHLLDAAVSVRQPEIAKLIFSHPNGKLITANGVYGLTKALQFAKLVGSRELIEIILAHPNAKDIPKDACRIDSQIHSV